MLAKFTCQKSLQTINYSSMGEMYCNIVLLKSEHLRFFRWEPNKSHMSKGQSTTVKTMVYEYHCEGDIFICGDFNAKCGNTQDAKNSTAKIPNRLTIDHSSNVAGKLLLDFLESADICMLNGRFGDTSNRYTSFSPLGMSLVDYCLVPIELLNNFSQFTVQPIPELVDQLKIQVGSTLPDHSILTWKLSLTLTIKPTPHDPKSPHYVTLLTEDYFKTAVAREEMENLCASIKHLPSDQAPLDSIYDQFCALVDSQLLT